MNFTKLFRFALLAIILLQACKSEEAKDTTPPLRVSDLIAEPVNQAVVLRWTNTGENVKHFEITYGDQLLTLGTDKDFVRIDNLVNGQEYTFAMVVVGKNDVKSDPMTVIATPDKYVTQVEGKDFLSGTYRNTSYSLLTEVTITGNNYKKTLTAGNNKFIWEGTLNKQNDTTYRFVVEYSMISNMGTTHVANIVEDHNSVMCFSSLKGDSIYYVQTAYEKIEGDPKFLPGKYKRYIKSYSDDWLPGNDTTYYYIDIDANGNISRYDTFNLDVSNETWTNDDLLNGNYFFVTLNSRIYIIDKKNTQLSAK